MSTDIHMFVERQFGNKWKRVSDERGIVSPHYSEDLSDSLKETLSKKRWHPGFHYALYGQLAGVRSKQFEAVVLPRGLPQDASMGVKLQFRENERHIHTPSYLTLEEIIHWREQSVPVTYFLNADQFGAYLKAGNVINDDNTDSYYVTCPRGATVVSNDKMKRIMNMSNMFEYNEYITKVDQPYKHGSVSKAFWTDMAEAMQQVCSDPTKIRCVFWFEEV